MKARRRNGLLVEFDDTDADPVDGIPDDIAIHAPGEFAVAVLHDLGDGDGEIDVLIADVEPPVATLSDGPLVTVTFTATCSPASGVTITAPVTFSDDPAATFSDDLAQDVPGTTVNGWVVPIYDRPTHIHLPKRERRIKCPSSLEHFAG